MQDRKVWRNITKELEAREILDTWAKAKNMSKEDKEMDRKYLVKKFNLPCEKLECSANLKSSTLCPICINAENDIKAKKPMNKKSNRN